MTLADIIEVCLNCIGYAYEQVTTSHIDVLGLDYHYNTNDESEAETKKRLLTAYAELDSLIPGVPYFKIPTCDLQEYFEQQEVENEVYYP